MTIEVKNLTHTYSEGLPHESIALDDISFTIEDGEFVGIIGHTGSGKSTLLQHLNGLLKPNSGSVLIDGKDITSGKVPMIDIRRRVGLLFQYPEYQLFEETVAKDVAFGPLNLGLDKDEVDLRVKGALIAVGLEYDAIKNLSPFELSGGQKRRVAFAGVIAMKPDVLILDEPTAGLNPKAHKDILRLVTDIHESHHGNEAQEDKESNGKAKKTTIILVSHNMNDIAMLCDKVLVIDHGKLVMNGCPEEVFSKAEELKAMGLALPEAAEITSRLTKGGIKISSSCLTIEQAADEIAKAMRDKRL